MSNRRYNDEEKISLRYFYECNENDIPVLKNKLGIKDQNSLNIVEDKITSPLIHSRQKINLFTLKEIQGIHKHIFEPIYDWAGKIRDYTTGRGTVSFARPEMIKDYYDNQIFSKLKNEKYLIGSTQDEFIKRSAYFINEFNAVHPFIDGNGRMTGIFLVDLAEKSGHKLNTNHIKKEDWYKAMEIGFSTGKTDLIQKEIKKCIDIAINLNFQEIAKKQKNQFQSTTQTIKLKI